MLATIKFVWTALILNGNEASESLTNGRIWICGIEMSVLKWPQKQSQSIKKKTKIPRAARAA